MGSFRCISVVLLLGGGYFHRRWVAAFIRDMKIFMRDVPSKNPIDGSRHTTKDMLKNQIVGVIKLMT